MEVLNHISAWITTTCGNADAWWFGVRLCRRRERQNGEKEKWKESGREKEGDCDCERGIGFK
jgi:hypothetical protein